MATLFTEIITVLTFTDREIRNQVKKIGVVLDKDVAAEAINRYITVSDKHYDKLVKTKRIDVTRIPTDKADISEEIKTSLMYYAAYRCCVDSITDQPAAGNLNQLIAKDKWREKADEYKSLFKEAEAELTTADFVEVPEDEAYVNSGFIAEGVRR